MCCRLFPMVKSQNGKDREVAIARIEWKATPEMRFRGCFFVWCFLDTSDATIIAKRGQYISRHVPGPPNKGGKL